MELELKGYNLEIQLLALIEKQNLSAINKFFAHYLVAQFLYTLRNIVRDDRLLTKSEHLNSSSTQEKQTTASDIIEKAN